MRVDLCDSDDVVLASWDTDVPPAPGDSVTLADDTRFLVVSRRFADGGARLVLTLSHWTEPEDEVPADLWKAHGSSGAPAHRPFPILGS